MPEMDSINAGDRSAVSGLLEIGYQVMNRLGLQSEVRV